MAKQYQPKQARQPFIDPTPQRIAIECERIQARWTAGERKRRIVDDTTRRLAVELRSPVPVIRVEDLDNPDDA